VTEYPDGTFSVTVSETPCVKKTCVVQAPTPTVYVCVPPADAGAAAV
jgi:hypothetical protein